MSAPQIRAASTQIATPIEQALSDVIWRRRQLAAVTFGIELRDVSIMLASDYDRIAENIQRTVGTCHPIIDEFWCRYFSPMTTSWIHHHPDLPTVERMFDRYRAIMGPAFDFTRPRYAALLKRKV